jgi:endogenous inhibitor of DNA gyrase (YacG/DUF329 family)
LSQVRCPICERLFDSDESRTLPFCSKRCKQIDLRRWLVEGYGLQYESRDEEGEDRIPPDED